MSLSEQDHEEPAVAGRPDWPGVWRAVAARLREQRQHGLGHLLTEGTLRHDLVQVLVGSGVDPRRLAVEWPANVLQGGKVDLVLDPPSGAAVELKYPRGSRTPISPDTMTLGEMLRDFLRVSMLSFEEAWVAQVVDTRLRGYLERVESRHPLRWSFTEGHDLVIDPLTLAGLPRTATGAVGGMVVPAPVVATCVVAVEVDETLGLYAYRVQPADSAHEEQAARDAPPRLPV